MADAPVVLLAAGGTGGHLFPAEALAGALARRGITVDLATDARFNTNPGRARNRDVLEPLLEKAMATRTTADWIEKFWAAGVPSSPVADLTEVFANPQVLHREMLLTAEHPTIAEGVRMTCVPVKLGDTPAAVRRHPPLAGEYTREVLREIGYKDAEIAALEAKGVAKSWQ